MNGADVIVAIAVGIVVLLAAAMIRRNRRNGKRSCGCQCSDCGYGCGKSILAGEKGPVEQISTRSDSVNSFASLKDYAQNLLRGDD